jgi:heat shock protein HslJ
MRLAFLLATLALAGCAMPARSDTPVTSIANTKWVVPIEGDAADRPRLEFMSDGRIGGYTGCNTLSGTWKMEGSLVRLGPLVMTKRACLGPRDEIERRFLQAVNAEARISIKDGRLVAEGANGARLELSPENPKV